MCNNIIKEPLSLLIAKIAGNHMKQQNKHDNGLIKMSNSILRALLNSVNMRANIPGTLSWVNRSLGGIWDHTFMSKYGKRFSAWAVCICFG